MRLILIKSTVIIASFFVSCEDNQSVNINDPAKNISTCITEITFAVSEYSDAPNSILIRLGKDDIVDSLLSQKMISKYVITTDNIKHSQHYVMKNSDTDKDKIDLIFAGLFYKDPQGILRSEQDVIDEFSSCTLTLITNRNDSLDIEFCSEPKVKFEMK